jgi:GcrA cell cycle regulator
MTHKLTAASEDWFRRAWVKNTALFAMSQHLGVHQDTLHRLAKEMNLAPRRSNNERWSEEHSARMEVLWRQGLSASQTATALSKQFGLTYSRNAVIGRANRMGLSGRDKPAKPKTVARAPVVRPPAKPRTVEAGRPSRAKIRQPMALGSFIPTPTYGGNGLALATANAVLNAAAKATRLDEPDKPTGIKLEHLTGRMCKWPIGDVQDDDFSFCGCAREDHRPYCEAHNERAYSAPLPRKVKPYDPGEHRPRRAA